MPIQIDLPSALEERLRAAVGDLAATGKEAMLVELYRQGQISHGELAECLGLSRCETDVVLKNHSVTEDLISSGELAEQTMGLRKIVR